MKETGEAIKIDLTVRSIWGRVVIYEFSSHIYNQNNGLDVNKIIFCILTLALLYKSI